MYTCAIGIAAARGGRDQIFENKAIRGKKWTEKWETIRNSKQEMGKKWETRRNSRREMGVNGKRDDTNYIIFQQKMKTREKTGKQGGKHYKKAGKNRR